jgi:O-antigen ligase
MAESTSISSRQRAHAQPDSKQLSLAYVCSGILFRLGLALLTFEQIRPAFDIQLSDYFFLLSLLLLLSEPSTLSIGREPAKLLIPCWIVLAGCLISLAGGSGLSGALAPLARFVVLFGLLAPLSIIHSKNIRQNMLFILGGIFVNSVVTIIQASVFPQIVDVLSINPTRPDISDVGRFQGLTSHPNIIGLSAGLAVLIGVGFLAFEEYKHLRLPMIVVVVGSSVAALLSGSRAVFVALLPSLFVMAIAQRQRRQIIVRMVVAFVVIWGVTSYVAPSVMSQFSSRLDASGIDVSSDYGRFMSAIYAVSEIAQKPIIGWGIDHFNEAGLTEVPWTGEIVGVHNTLLKYWHGAGIVGAIGFAALFFVPVRIVWKRARKATSKKAVHMLSLGLGCIVYLFIVSNLGPFDYNRFLYIPVFIVGGFAARYRASQTQQSGPRRAQASVLGRSLNTETA